MCLSIINNTMTETKWSRFDFVPISCKRGLILLTLLALQINVLSDSSCSSLSSLSQSLSTQPAPMCSYDCYSHSDHQITFLRTEPTVTRLDDRRYTRDKQRALCINLTRKDLANYRGHTETAYFSQRIKLCIMHKLYNRLITYSVYSARQSKTFITNNVHFSHEYLY